MGDATVVLSVGLIVAGALVLLGLSAAPDYAVFALALSMTIIAVVLELIVTRGY